MHSRLSSRLVFGLSVGRWRTYVTTRGFSDKQPAHITAIKEDGEDEDECKPFVYPSETARTITRTRTALENRGRSLKITWADGESAAYNAAWLRHNCQCPLCVTSSNQKAVDPTLLDPYTTVYTVGNPCGTCMCVYVHASCNLAVFTASIASATIRKCKLCREGRSELQTCLYLSKKKHQCRPIVLHVLNLMQHCSFAGGVVKLTWSCGHQGYINENWLRHCQQSRQEAVKGDLSRPPPAVNITSSIWHATFISSSYMVLLCACDCRPAFQD